MLRFLIAFLLFSTLATAQTTAPTPDPATQKLVYNNESDLGIVINDGNSRSESYTASMKNIFTILQKNKIENKANFYRSSSYGVENVYRWFLSLRFERELIKKLDIFIAESVETDRFAGIRQRYNTDIGLKYFILKEEKGEWAIEGGYRYTHINRESPTVEAIDSFNSARVATSGLYKHSDAVSVNASVEYIPNFSAPQAYNINTDLSISSALTKIFALKVSYTTRYSNTPPPGVIKYLDTVFTTSLNMKLAF